MHCAWFHSRRDLGSSNLKFLLGRNEANGNLLLHFPRAFLKDNFRFESSRKNSAPDEPEPERSGTQSIIIFVVFLRASGPSGVSVVRFRFCFASNSKDAETPKAEQFYGHSAVFAHIK